MAAILASQGPLAIVWLASNYDKKLSKQQFLNTDIISSSSLISQKQLPGESAGTITLRLSSQLLLGIVRIYLRKTKYLLDDVHEALYKLKNSFKYASGASLGPSITSVVNLLPQKTTLSNPSRIQLQDQVTDLELFYQEDLVLDDAPHITADVFGTTEFDHLVEVGRHTDAAADFDLDLDFDLEGETTVDPSIEEGRDALVALPEADQSLLDMNIKSNPDALLPSMELSEPLEPRPTPSSADLDEPLTPGRAPSEDASAHRTSRREATSGVIATNKRKLVVDSRYEVERGISNNVLREIQSFQTNRRFTTDMLIVPLKLQQKLELIEELTEPLSSKRRKITNIDENLRRRCLEFSLEEETSSTSHNIGQDETGLDLNIDTDINFDLTLPELESDKASTPEESAQVDFEGLELAHDDSNIENLRSTAQVAGHLREMFCEAPLVSFDYLIHKDINMRNGTPLGATSIADASVKVSGRREATKCFFELLVLAGHDCITLEQSPPGDGVSLPDAPSIRPKDNLATQFL